MKESIDIITARLRTRQETRIAIQKDGRLSAIAWKLLAACMEAAGITMPKEADPKERGRKLVISPKDAPNLKIILARGSDIPWWVSGGSADFGIAGEDQAIEQGAEALIAGRLGEGRCTLVFSVRSDSPVSALSDLNGKVIATSFPNIVSGYCGKNGIKPKCIIKLAGSVEATAMIGDADAIADLIETGETQKANFLRAFAIIRSFEAVLLSKNKSQQPS